MGNLSLFIKSNDVSRVKLHHPDTKEHVGILLIAGPEHPATKAWERDILDRRQKRGYTPASRAESTEGLRRRTVGWENVKDSETGDNMPFNPDLLEDLYSQDWLIGQVIDALADESFFYRE